MATSSSSLCPSVSRDYGVSDPLRCGLAPRRERTEVGQFGHPLEASEKAFESTRHANELEQLRKLQGLHAPIRMQMERKAVNKVCLVVVVCMLCFGFCSGSDRDDIDRFIQGNQVVVTVQYPACVP